MIYYWYRHLWALIRRKVKPWQDLPLSVQESFRVGLLDVDPYGVMFAARYPVYMDIVREAAIYQSTLSQSMFKRGLVPFLGSQKLIYRRPLKVGSRFTVRMETVGWDDKWIYQVYRFEQREKLMAMGVTRALLWQNGTKGSRTEMLREANLAVRQEPPDWVLAYFSEDRENMGK